MLYVVLLMVAVTMRSVLESPWQNSLYIQRHRETDRQTNRDRNRGRGRDRERENSNSKT